MRKKLPAGTFNRIFSYFFREDKKGHIMHN